MWQCTKCGESISEGFDRCWKCGNLRDGSQAKDRSKVSPETGLPSDLLLSQVVAANAGARSHGSNHSARQEVMIVDINLPFKSMVVFMVKWALASIPAFMILLILAFIFSGLIAGVVKAIAR